MGTYVRAVVRDKNGRIIKDTGWRETNTLTRNFFALLYTPAIGIEAPCVRIDGSKGMIAPPDANVPAHYHGYVGAPEGDDTWGLVVGTGTKSPTRDDYDLERPIPHGDTAGSLHYYNTDIGFGDDYVEVVRMFKNTGGTSITIREVGLVAQYYDTNEDTHRKVLIARSLFTVTIPDGGSATIYYKISG